jgi:hypothetical protein
VEAEPLVSRDELTGIFFVITDLGVDVKKILRILEELDGEDPEEDA